MLMESLDVLSFNTSTMIVIVMTITILSTLFACFWKIGPKAEQERKIPEFLVFDPEAQKEFLYPDAYQANKYLVIFESQKFPSLNQF